MLGAGGERAGGELVVRRTKVKKADHERGAENERRERGTKSQKTGFSMSQKRKTGFQRGAATEEEDGRSRERIGQQGGRKRKT